MDRKGIFFALLEASNGRGCSLDIGQSATLQTPPVDSSPAGYALPVCSLSVRRRPDWRAPSALLSRDRSKTTEIL